LGYTPSTTNTLNSPRKNIMAYKGSIVEEVVNKDEIFRERVSKFRR